jgi:hypothetical protein
VYAGYTPWGGIVRVGAVGVLPRAATPEAALLRGFTGRRSYWAFTLESPRALWILEDTSRYERAPAAVQLSFGAALSAPTLASAADDGASPATRPVLYRASAGTAVVAWRWASPLMTWEEDAARKVHLGEVCVSMAGRLEPAAGGSVWVVYTTSRTRLFRVDTAARTTRVLREAPPQHRFRGVALPPYGSPAAAPSPSRSATPARTRAATTLPSGGRSAKARPG